MEKFRVAVVGCGAISGAYLKFAKNFPILDVVACADLNQEAAKARAAEFGIPRVATVDEVLKDPSIEAILNLTIPKAHAAVALQAIEAGKHVYSEKPLGINREEGEAVVAAAKAKGVRVGNAPDTFFGAGHQTARKLIDEGAIGRPVAATAYMMSRGVEHWHPNPEFYYEVGGGPLFDMGPYYLTDLLQLLGPAKRVAALTTIAIPERTITNKTKYGKKITVQTPDHISGSIEFANGTLVTMVKSFAVRFAEQWPITIYGTDGTIKVPDPNGFDGDVFLRKTDDAEWTKVEPTHRTGYGRAVGLADLAWAVRKNRPHRASDQLAFAVLDIMQAFIDSGETGRAIDLQQTGFQRPAPLPVNVAEGVLD